MGVMGVRKAVGGDGARSYPPYLQPPCLLSLFRLILFAIIPIVFSDSPVGSCYKSSLFPDNISIVAY